MSFFFSLSRSPSSSRAFFSLLVPNRNLDEKQRSATIGRKRNCQSFSFFPDVFPPTEKKCHRATSFLLSLERTILTGEINSRADFVLVRVLPSTDQRFSDDIADEQVTLIERLPQAFFFLSFSLSLCSRRQDSLAFARPPTAYIRHGETLPNGIDFRSREQSFTSILYLTNQHEKQNRGTRGPTDRVLDREIEVHGGSCLVSD